MRKRKHSTQAVISDSDEDDPQSPKKVYSTPSQDALRKKISAQQIKVEYLRKSRDSGLGDADCQSKLEKAQKEVRDMTKKLKALENNMNYQRKFRHSFKERILAIKGPESGALFKDKVGRPRLEETYPDLLDNLQKIAIAGSAAHDRRRTEEIRACKSLDDLHKCLEAKGYALSRSATYLRLLPRNYTTIEGRRHVKTVPVRLCRAQNDERKVHPDGKFCTNTIRSLESIASFLGPTQVGFISQDDKAHIPLGLTAANKQAPILMHMDYKVRLADHDFVIAPKHKLTPSVYAGIVIEPHGLGNAEAVSYSGPSYIAIRSLKHSSSTSASHAADFKRLLEIPDFQENLMHEGQVKPILIFTVDGGPDENPR